jgi:hypothetical protein
MIESLFMSLDLFVQASKIDKKNETGAESAEEFHIGPISYKIRYLIESKKGSILFYNPNTIKPL